MNAPIEKITRVYVRHYSDTGQKTAYVEWVSHGGATGRTEGPVLAESGKLAEVYGDHMGALIARAICHGVEVERETW
jgi:hypothetical protein